MSESLARLSITKKAKIISLAGGIGFQNKLRNMGIREGKIVRIVTRQPLGGPIVLEINGKTTTIGRGMAQKILVEEI
jgi:ferrous iron transport protein A